MPSMNAVTASAETLSTANSGSGARSVGQDTALADGQVSRTADRAADPIVRGLLTRSGALLCGHFQLSSGLHSPHYVQCARLFESPRRAETVGRLLADRCRDLAPDLVVGPALGGIVIAHEVARALDTRCLFTERQEGAMALRRGFAIGPGERVLVVEDVITTGKSSREVLQVVESAGGRVVGFGCAVDRLGADTLSDRPLRGLVRIELETYEAGACPLCAAGAPVVKPGSRPNS